MVVVQFLVLQLNEEHVKCDDVLCSANEQILFLTNLGLGTTNSLHSPHVADVYGGLKLPSNVHTLFGSN